MTSNSVGQSGAAKAMSIFKAFAGDQTELSLTQICDRTELRRSTAHRWLQELVTHGALTKLPNGCYCPSQLMWKIATRCTRPSIMREIARPYVQGLLKTTRGYVQLAVPAGDEALIIERISRSTAMKPVGRVGGQLPLHSTGAGKVILAYAPNEFRNRILNRPLTRYTEHTITTPEAMKEELENIRRRGYATSLEERTIGIVSYAVPIFEHGSDSVVIAAVSVLVESREDGVLNALRPAAVDISRALRKLPSTHSLDGL
ncbi:MAG: IclR family transcriptional regulator [Streptomyces sp.]|nr:IclR family transcriptional regulator [Streptomyces sp.]